MRGYDCTHCHVTFNCCGDFSATSSSYSCLGTDCGALILPPPPSAHEEAMQQNAGGGQRHFVAQ